MDKKTAYKTIENYIGDLLNDKSETSVNINSTNLINFLLSLPFDKEISIKSRKSHIDTIKLYIQDPMCETNERCLKLTMTGLKVDVLNCVHLD